MNSRPSPLRYLIITLFCLFAIPVQASVAEMSGEWFQLPEEEGQFLTYQQIQQSRLQPIEQISLTGGRYLWRGSVALETAGQYAIDFKNTSIIGRFQHFIIDEQGKLVASFEGGIESDAFNPFFLRHGRQLALQPGHYKLYSIVSSPFYIGQPQPYIDPLKDYLEGIKSSNAMALIFMGVFLSLGIYYLTLGLVRGRAADGMYAGFILGNLFFTGTSLLIFKELFDIRTVYTLSFPILLSNIAYIAFVITLLKINKQNYPRLFNTGLILIGLLSLFFIIALFKPNWSLELDRYGVALFLFYGLTSGFITARRGNETARMYLIAISAFFLFGGLAITVSQIQGSNYFYIEHMGMLAVSVEVTLLALVLAHQFASVYREKEFIQKSLEKSRREAYTDPLTGLPNRYALDAALNDLSGDGCLTFIDLDRLKYYNDRFGHARGDELLCSFASSVSSVLNSDATLFRVAGDEFAIVCPSGQSGHVEEAVDSAVRLLQQCDFKQADASKGTAFVRETQSLSDLKHLADTRMYREKKKKNPHLQSF